MKSGLSNSDIGTYDAGRTVDWDEISWDETLPSGCDIELQIAVSANADGPWTFVGPDGTSGTKFTASGTAVNTGTSGRYARYKAFLTGNGTATPTLENVHISYSGNVDSQMRTTTFDAAGNITEKKVVTDSSTVTEKMDDAAWSASDRINDLNQIKRRDVTDSGGTTTWSYTYDSNGNMTSKDDGTDTWDYTWDEDNRLVEVEKNSSTVVTYEYDLNSRLIKRVEGSLITTFEWDGWDLVREEKTGSVSETTDYYAPEGEVHSFKRGGNIYHLHSDGLSSIQMVTDPNGNSVARLVYEAWGGVLDETETLSGDLDVSFVGGLGVRRDQSTELIYMRHRWYALETRQFISRDPIGHAGGLALYQYANNRPINDVDPAGLVPTTEDRFNLLRAHYNKATTKKRNCIDFFNYLRRILGKSRSETEFILLIQGLMVPSKAMPARMKQVFPTPPSDPNFRATFPQRGWRHAFRDHYFPEDKIDQGHHLAFFLAAGYLIGNNPYTWRQARALERANMEELKRPSINQGDLNLSYLGLKYGARLRNAQAEGNCGTPSQENISNMIDNMEKEICL